MIHKRKEIEHDTKKWVSINDSKRWMWKTKEWISIARGGCGRQRNGYV